MKYVRLAAGPLLLFILWMWVTARGDISAILLPSPESVAQTFVRLTESGDLIHHIGASAARALAGFALASAVGLGLGLILSQSRRSYECADTLINAFRITPPLALIPLLILWLGIEEAPKVAVVFLSGFFPIYLNTFSAFASVDKKFLEVAADLEMTPRETFRFVLWPAALPGILTGIRIGFGYCWRALVGAELIAASSGLGFMISEAGEMMKTDVVFVGIIVIAVLGIAMDKILVKVMLQIPALKRTGAGFAQRVHPQ